MHYKYPFYLLAFLLFLSWQTASAQTYQPDPSFNAPLLKSFTSSVYAALKQPDGKVVIGGDFHYVSKGEITAVARLNADGTLDQTFAKSIVFGFVLSLAIQPDGKILAGGSVRTSWDLPEQPLVRLNADGTVDYSFRASLKAVPRLSKIAVQPDGKILVQGGPPGTKDLITRLNPDGSVDASFSFSGAYPTGGESYLHALQLQPDGKIIIGGFFALPNGQAVRLARLHPNGTPDDTFRVALDASAWVQAVIAMPGGKVLIGGAFSQVNGVPRNCIARLNADGTLDASFDPGTGLDKNGNLKREEINAIAVQNDGKLLIGGAFTSYNGTASNRLARLEANGALDEAFRNNVGAGPTGYVLVIIPQGNGKLVAGGYFTAFNGQNKYSIVGLNADGTTDANYLTYLERSAFAQLLVQPDGKLLINGFGTINDQPARGIVRLNPDGTPDEGFTANASSELMQLYPDGKILAVSQSGTLIRLNPDGSRDGSFSAPPTFNRSVVVMAVLADGKIMVGGFFTTVNGTPHNRLVRLNADGSVDGTFNTGTGFDEITESILPQPDGRVIVGGWFSNYDGTPQRQIARLNADGTLDKSFVASGSGRDYFDLQTISSLTRQADGKIVVGGTFHTLNGVGKKNLARLLPDGVLDNTFTTPDSVLTFSRRPFPLQADGKLLLASTKKDKPVVRLNPDGTYDPAFALEGVPPGGVSVTLQPDQKVLVTSAGRLSRFAVLQSQTISFPSIPDKLSNDAPFTLSATASSGLPVVFTVVTGPATVAGNTLTLTGPGTVTVRATQAGSGSYAAAPAVEQTFKVEAVLGVEDLAGPVRLYPNPAPGAFTIELPHRHGLELRLFNAQGQAVRVFWTDTAEGIRVKASHLPAGLYVLHLRAGGRQGSRKVLIK